MISDNFFDKKKYVINYENLELNLMPGLNLSKIYGILEFNQ